MRFVEFQMIGLNPIYMFNCNQNVSIKVYESGIAAINCGILQGPVLGQLFLLYINDIHQSIKFYKVHHFTDDTNLVYSHNQYIAWFAQVLL